MSLVVVNDRGTSSGVRSLAPIPASQRLSFDILWYLYSFVMYSDSDRGPTTLSHISRLWRQTALQTAFLWTRITIHLVLSSQRHLQALSRLHRSKTRPVELVIRASRGWKDGEIEKLVHTHAHRIMKLEVHTMGLSRTLIWKEFVGVRFPILEEFDGLGGDLRVRLGREIVKKANRIGALAADTKRQHQEEKETDYSSLIPFTPSIGVVVWSDWTPRRLTSLTLMTSGLCDTLSFMDFYRILSLSRDTLRDFEFEGFTPNVQPSLVGNLQRLSAIVLPALTSLSLAFYDSTFLVPFFLMPPRLESLTLRNFIACPRAPYRLVTRLPVSRRFTTGPNLLRCISRWDTIKNLGLYSIDDLPKSQTWEYLNRLGNLESLVLHDERGPESIANCFLIKSPQDFPILPRLKHFTCTMLPGRPLNLPVLLEIRRVHNLPRLETLSLDKRFICHLMCLYQADFLKFAADAVRCIDHPDPSVLPTIDEARILVKDEFWATPKPTF